MEVEAARKGLKLVSRYHVVQLLKVCTAMRSPTWVADVTEQILILKPLSQRPGTPGSDRCPCLHLSTKTRLAERAMRLDFCGGWTVSGSYVQVL
jgi:hypothetical protein